MTQNRCFSERMFLITYSILLTEKYDEEDIKKQIRNSEVKLDAEQLEILINCFQNKDDLVQLIESYLIKWKFRRLSLVDQSVLLLAAHYITHSICDDPISISVSLDLVKEFSDAEKHKYINAVLDKISKNKGSTNEQQ